MKLHLGCGKRYIPGFIHIDIASHKHIDYQTSVDNLFEIEDSSCSLIYASHVLPYFDKIDVPVVLKEWYRVLEIGGTLRLCVPNFDKYAALYQITKNLDLLIGALHGRMEIESVDGIKEVIHIKSTYDFETLKSSLIESGFVNVEVYDWHNTIHAQYDDYSQAYYPHMDKENGLLMSLNVKSEKA